MWSQPAEATATTRAASMVSNPYLERCATLVAEYRMAVQRSEQNKGEQA
jgi:hypothetical protein